MGSCSSFDLEALPLVRQQVTDPPAYDLPLGRGLLRLFKTREARCWLSWLPCDPECWIADQIRVLQRTTLDCTSPLQDPVTDLFAGSKFTQIIR